MPRPKWTLNTIYISERLQERLRPISRCALTTVVAPMGEHIGSRLFCMPLRYANRIKPSARFQDFYDYIL